LALQEKTRHETGLENGFSRSAGKATNQLEEVELVMDFPQRSGSSPANLSAPMTPTARAAAKTISTKVNNHHSTIGEHVSASRQGRKEVRLGMRTGFPRIFVFPIR
jgi:hypothetical protein